MPKNERKVKGYGDTFLKGCEDLSEGHVLKK